MEKKVETTIVDWDYFKVRVWGVGIRDRGLGIWV